MSSITRGLVHDCPWSMQFITLSADIQILCVWLLSEPLDPYCCVALEKLLSIYNTNETVPGMPETKETFDWMALIGVWRLTRILAVVPTRTDTYSRMHFLLVLSLRESEVCFHRGIK